MSISDFYYAILTPPPKKKNSFWKMFMTSKIFEIIKNHILC